MVFGCLVFVDGRKDKQGNTSARVGGAITS
jgi:hypothetical protein